MAQRALWKGQLRLSLVSIPVELYAAHNSAAKVSFRQIHTPSGKRVHYEKSVTGIGPIKSDDIVKGYEIDGDYILLEPDEIDAIKLETKKTLDLVQFVGSCEIPPLNRPGFTGGQNSRRIARYGTDIKEEDREAVFARVPRACGAAGGGTPR